MKTHALIFLLTFFSNAYSMESQQSIKSDATSEDTDDLDATEKGISKALGVPQIKESYYQRNQNLVNSLNETNARFERFEKYDIVHKVVTYTAILGAYGCFGYLIL